LAEVAVPGGPLQRLRNQLPAESGPTGPTCRVFTIDGGRNDAGGCG
jgi:hypothetical protein